MHTHTNKTNENTVSETIPHKKKIKVKMPNKAVIDKN